MKQDEFFQNWNHQGTTCLISQCLLGHIQGLIPTLVVGTNQKPVGLDKSHTYMHDVIKITNFTNCHTWLYFNKYPHEHIFSFLSTWSNLAHIYFKTICTSDFKTNNMTCFSFHVLCPSYKYFKSYYSF